jgi:hypothetical protein
MMRKDRDIIHMLLMVQILEWWLKCLRVCLGTFSARYFLTDISIWGGQIEI